MAPTSPCLARSGSGEEVGGACPGFAQVRGGVGLANGGQLLHPVARPWIGGSLSSPRNHGTYGTGWGGFNVGKTMP